MSLEDALDRIEELERDCERKENNVRSVTETYNILLNAMKTATDNLKQHIDTTNSYLENSDLRYPL